MSWGRPSLKTILVISFLAFGLLACGASDVATRPGAADRSGPSQSRPAVTKPIMTKMSANVTEHHTRIVLDGNAPLTYTSFMLAQPPVIIVDVSAKAAPAALGLTQIKNGTVEKIEVGPVSGNKKLIRVKISLDKKTNYKVVREGSQLVVMVENLAGTGPPASADKFQIKEVPLTPQQTSGGTAYVTAVDFKPLDQTGRTRLEIKTSKLVKSEILTKNQGRTIILSLKPARIPQHLTRALDTSFFESAVNYIRPAPAGAQGVRFVIRLRQVVPYHLGQKGVITYLDFDSSALQPKTVSLPQADPKGTKVPGKAKDIAVEKTVETKVVKGDSASPVEYKGQKISLDFQNADIHNIIRLIGEVSGKNVVVSDRVMGKVTLKLKDVPWDQALDIILTANQLGMVETGNVLRIDKLDVLRAARERLVQEQTEKREQAKDVPLVKKVLTPRYAAVATMKTELEKLKTDRGKITVIGNDIYIEEEPDTLAQMEEVFNKNDQVAKQILIEARIVEALSSFTKNLGVNWGGDYAIDDPGVVGGAWNLYGTHEAGVAGAGGPAVNLIGPPATGLGIGIALTTGVLSLDAKLYAMEQTGEGRIVSAPRILASNDEEVHIKQGQSIPYETSGTTTSPATITYNEAVLELRVKPHIEENGKIISMDIKVTKDTPDYSRTTRNPPINKREAKTKLMVKSGQTVVIGGIIIDEKSKSINRVPGLHRIPVIGWLFKNYQVSDTKLELLIFLTSHIIPVKI